MEQKSRERRKMGLCVRTQTVHCQGREMRAEWPFRGRRLAHDALYEKLLCQETELVRCVFPNQDQFRLSVSFFQTYGFYHKY
jgi:hypothetical protein